MSRPHILLLLAFLSPLHGGDFLRIPAGKYRGFAFSNPFWMSRTEVTVRQFRDFVRATGYRTAAEQAGALRTWKVPGFPVHPEQPVVYVSVKDAEAYCHWAGGRLPTDGEWEYAARAGAEGRHYWGDRLDDRYLWYRGNSNGRPHPVGKKRPNQWGLHDMEGNVWEWTRSADEKGEAIGNRRGGSWVDCEDIDGGPNRMSSPLIGLSNSYKVPVRLEHRYDDIGFRCVCSSPFHSPANGVGVKRSPDLKAWRDERLLMLGQKDWPWAQYCSSARRTPREHSNRRWRQRIQEKETM